MFEQYTILKFLCKWKKGFHGLQLILTIEEELE